MNKRLSDFSLLSAPSAQDLLLVSHNNSLCSLYVSALSYYILGNAPANLYVGPTGLPGLQGATGPTGLQGQVGSRGLQGDTGAIGRTGPTGPQGNQGSQGSAGAMGPTGPVGRIGLEGPIGERGSTGPQGAPGIPASMGATGPTGPRGLGDTGPVGSYTRTTVTSSIILQASASGFLDLDMNSKSCLIYKLATSFPSWVRIYNSSSDRGSDSNRSITEDPDFYSGIITEVITSSDLPSVRFPLVVLAYNDDEFPSSNLPVTITNLSSQTREIVLELTILPLEK